MATVKQPRRRRPASVQTHKQKALERLPTSSLEALISHRGDYIGKWVCIIGTQRIRRLALLKDFYRLGSRYVLELVDLEGRVISSSIRNQEEFRKKQSLCLDAQVYDLSRWGFVAFDRNVRVMISWLDKEASLEDVLEWIKTASDIWHSYHFDLTRQVVREEESKTMAV